MTVTREGVVRSCDAMLREESGLTDWIHDGEWHLHRLSTVGNGGGGSSTGRGDQGRVPLGFGKKRARVSPQEGRRSRNGWSLLSSHLVVRLLLVVLVLSVVHEVVTKLKSFLETTRYPRVRERLA